MCPAGCELRLRRPPAPRPGRPAAALPASTSKPSTLVPRLAQRRPQLHLGAGVECTGHVVCQHELGLRSEARASASCWAWPDSPTPRCPTSASTPPESRTSEDNRAPSTAPSRSRWWSNCTLSAMVRTAREVPGRRRRPSWAAETPAIQPPRSSECFWCGRRGRPARPAVIGRAAGRPPRTSAVVAASSTAESRRTRWLAFMSAILSQRRVRREAPSGCRC